jgi:Zn-dependent protease with chaperone function
MLEGASIRRPQRVSWTVGGVLAFVGLAAVLCPTVDAAISRQGEFAADRFASDHGLALDLASVLNTMDDAGRAASAGWSGRLLASHPTSAQRIRALLAAASVSRV